jgi:2-oxoglutarate ferredoxin oxidoreductase subunit gamma
MMANIVALAALSTLTGVVSPKSLEEAVLARVPKGTGDMNKKAVKAGIKAARAYLKDKAAKA